MFARNYVFMNSELVAATDSNREAAKEWLDKWFTDDAPMTQSVPNMVRGSPGLRKLLEAAGAVQPDVMFIVSDGGFYEGSSSSGSGHGRRIPYKEIAQTLSDIQDSLPEKMAVNFIGAGMDRSDLQEMRRIINREGGTGFCYQDHRKCAHQVPDSLLINSASRPALRFSTKSRP